jgi:hypothetical protein
MTDAPALSLLGRADSDPKTVLPTGGTSRSRSLGLDALSVSEIVSGPAWIVRLEPSTSGGGADAY